jgi:hypothetical protein
MWKCPISWCTGRKKDICFIFGIAMVRVEADQELCREFQVYEALKI